jgi:hypothetical protein
MAVSYSPTLMTNRMQLVTDLVDSKVAAASTGAGSAGKLVIGTSALSGATGVLATFTLSMPAFAVSGTPALLTLDITPAVTSTASATGTAAKAEFRTAADAVIVSGLTVAAPSGGDINLNSTSITSGQTVTISSGTITHAT